MSQLAKALKLPRQHSTYSAALTQQHLCCSSHAASFLPQHPRRRLHGTASMLPLSHPCIHAAALMLQHSRSRILSTLSRRSIDAIALRMPYLCRSIHASACTPPFLCSSMHIPAFTPLSHRRIDAVALTPQHWCHRFDAAALHAPHFSVAASHRQPQAAAFTPSHTLPLTTTAFALQLCQNYSRTSESLLTGTQDILTVTSDLR